MANVCDEIRQVQPVHKRFDEYTEEEIRKFPKLLELPDDHTVETVYEDNQSNQQVKA